MKPLLWMLGKILAFLAIMLIGELLFVPFHLLIFYMLTYICGFPQELLFEEWGLKANKSAPWTMAGAAILASWIMARFFDKRPLASLGLKFHPRWWKELLWGIFLGTGLVLFLVAILLALRLMQFEVFKEYQLEQERGRVLVTLGLALPFYAGVAVFEEVGARGYIFQTLIKGVGITPAFLLSSLWFAIGHQPYPWAPLSAGLGGLLMALAVWKTRSLWCSIGIHFAFNYLHYLLRLSYKPTWQSVIILATGVGLVTTALMKFPKPDLQMEALWQQYVLIAQPWAQLKAWWARHKQAARDQTPPAS